MEAMKVRVLVGAEFAYAAINLPNKSMDIRLAGGRGAAQSLKETAAAWRAHAAQLLSDADLAEAAAALI